jgi:hypothetical protein
MAASKILSWSIYVLRCPRTREARYVGWTAIAIEARLRCHIQEAVRSQHTHKCKWIMSLVSIGLNPLIEVIETGTGAAWGEAERRWIALYRARGARLVNGTDGGEGTPGMAAWGTAQQRSEASRKGRAALTPEQRRKWMKNWNAAKTAEQQHESTKHARAARMAQTTPEQRSESYWKGRNAMGPERRSAAAKKAHAISTPEQRSAVVRKGKATMGPERRSEAVRKGRAAMTPEQRSAAARKAYATRKRNISFDALP